MRLVFDILSFWQVGTGSGAMGTFDSRAARDPLHLPLIPGRQVKGLCREAMREAETFASVTNVKSGTTEALFGNRALPGQPLLDDPRPAALRFSDARMRPEERDALRGKDDLIACLYQTRRSTAMTETGTALPHSLRFDEVVIPLTLEAIVTVVPDAAPNDVIDWDTHLRAALGLLNAVGSGRTRGMGRVIVTLEA